MVRKHSDKLRVIGLSVWQSIADLEQQVQEFRPDWAVIGDHASTATDTLTDHVRVFEGNESLLDL
ncbi:MAG: hypothetical protein ACO3FE_18100, partial [Planctomycetaceae bacterium]